MLYLIGAAALALFGLLVVCLGIAAKRGDEQDWGVWERPPYWLDVDDVDWSGFNWKPVEPVTPKWDWLMLWLKVQVGRTYTIRIRVHTKRAEFALLQLGRTISQTTRSVQSLNRRIGGKP